MADGPLKRAASRELVGRAIGEPPLAVGLPPYQSVLPDGVLVRLYPTSGGWVPPVGPPPGQEGSYQTVADAYSSYEELRNENISYAQLAAISDSPVVRGGSARAVSPRGDSRPGPGTGGYGFVGGVVDAYGSEVWITGTEGWDGGPEMSVQSLESDVLRGTIVSNVLGRGRQVTVSGTIFRADGDDEAMRDSQRLISAALATPPHQGWLNINDFWLPVVLTGRVRQERIGLYRSDFEFSLVGREDSSAGGGVYLEQQPSQRVGLVGAGTGEGGSPSVILTNEGWVGVAPVIRWIPGAVNTGATLSAGGSLASQQMIFKPLKAPFWLLIDGAHYRVHLMSGVSEDGSDWHDWGSAHNHVEWEHSTWMEVPPGESSWRITTPTPPNAPVSAVVHWTRLS